MSDTLIAEHLEGGHKGIEEAKVSECALCKNYIDGLAHPASGDLGVNISQQVPLQDVFGKTT